MICFGNKILTYPIPRLSGVWQPERRRGGRGRGPEPRVPGVLAAVPAAVVAVGGVEPVQPADGTTAAAAATGMIGSPVVLSYFL